MHLSTPYSTVAGVSKRVSNIRRNGANAVAVARGNRLDQAICRKASKVVELRGALCKLEVIGSIPIRSTSEGPGNGAF
jgi:hypothetical protein